MKYGEKNVKRNNNKSKVYACGGPLAVATAQTNTKSSAVPPPIYPIFPTLFNPTHALFHIYFVGFDRTSNEMKQRKMEKHRIA